jgi:hypothetical protein
MRRLTHEAVPQEHPWEGPWSFFLRRVSLRSALAARGPSAPRQSPSGGKGPTTPPGSRGRRGRSGERSPNSYNSTKKALEGDFSLPFPLPPPPPFPSMHTRARAEEAGWGRRVAPGGPSRGGKGLCANSADAPRCLPPCSPMHAPTPLSTHPLLCERACPCAGQRRPTSCLGKKLDFSRSRALLHLKRRGCW